MSEKKRRWRITRRGFLIGAGVTGGALALGVAVGLPQVRLQMARSLDEGGDRDSSYSTDPTVWFEIEPDNMVRLYVPKVEMGQGIHTALAQIGAEELEIPFERLKVIQATTHLGPVDSSGTQGSSSVVNLYTPLRQAAATMREMLRVEAAEWLASPAETLVAREGGFEMENDPAVRVTYGELVANKTAWQVPEEEVEIPLKEPSQFRLIGTSQQRVDIPAKVTGQAVYGYDARLEGMLYGAVARPPTVEATMQGVQNADAVRAMPGVVTVVEDGEFVGVVAESRLQAWAARDALKISWREGRKWQQSDIDEIVTVGGRGGVTVQREGNAGAALKGATQLIEAEYRVPLAVHALMEPQAALAEVKADMVRVWTSTQNQDYTAEAIAEAIEREKEEVEVIPTYLGGGFGRKAIPEVGIEAARLAKVVGKPVHVGWTRPEEMRYGYHRPPTHNVFRAKLENGRVIALEHRQAGGDVLFGYFPAFLRVLFGADFGAWRGSLIRYDIPNRQVIAWRRKIPVPTGPWRALGLFANTFALESFIDELAHAAGADPLQFRLDHLSQEGEGLRWRTALQAVAERAGWGKPLPAGHAHGIACSVDVGTVVAQVAEVSLDENNKPRVHRIVAAMDCGRVINPDGAIAQVEGNIMWGVGSTFIEEMRIKDGQVDLRNFDTYPLLTMRDAPDVEVILLDSPIEEPRGVGEPAIGPVGAAIGNALFALTGKRLRQVPFTVERISTA